MQTETSRVTQAHDGVRLLVDRDEGEGPDGVIDDEFRVMIEADPRDPAFVDVLEELNIARVQVRARSIAVVDLASRRTFVALFDGNAEPESEQAHRRKDTSPTYFRGHGLSWSRVAATIDELNRSRFPAETDATCEAGGACGALSCSISCINGESCSVSCATHYSACCYCGGGIRRNLAFCNCVSCTN